MFFENKNGTHMGVIGRMENIRHTIEHKTSRSTANAVNNGSWCSAT